MLLTFLRRAVTDRITPESQVWRKAGNVNQADIAAALGLNPSAVAVDVVDIDHGTSQRSRLLVRHDGTTRTFFAKNTPIKFGSRVLNAAAKLCEREANFYSSIAPDIPTAPRSLIAKWEPRTGRTAVVLTDLTEDGFVFSPGAQPCTPEQVGLALDALADLHAYQPAGDRADADIYVLDNASMRRLSKTVCRVIGRGPKSIVDLVPDSVLKQSRILATRPSEFSEALASFPQAFIHNDTHRGNIGFADDRAILIDWQNCGWGPAIKDVAYLMVTSLEPEDRRTHERELLARYLRGVEAAGGRAMSPDDAWFAYRVLAITGYIAAAFTAMFRNRLQAAANGEESLRRASAAVQDLDSFSALQQQIDNPRRFP